MRYLLILNFFPDLIKYNSETRPRTVFFEKKQLFDFMNIIF